MLIQVELSALGVSDRHPVSRALDLVGIAGGATQYLNHRAVYSEEAEGVYEVSNGGGVGSMTYFTYGSIGVGRRRPFNTPSS